MKKYVLLFIYILYISVCSLSPKIHPNTTECIVDWTNKSVDSLLVFNDTVSSFQLKPKYKKLTMPFSTKEKEIRPKGNMYGYVINVIDGRYYTVAKHRDKCGYDYKLIVYNIDGENNTEILVSQINSYRKGSLVDALVLEMNFTFETEYFARYTVNDSIIKIDRYEINGILYTEDGGIIGEKMVTDTIVNHSIYKIKDGRFVKSLE